MVITSRREGLRVQLLCCVCRERLTSTTAWLVFPTDGERAEGRWVHRGCLNGRVATLFGAASCTLLRGSDALVHLAQNLTVE